VIKRITQQQLESYLWGAAVLLRGTIDAGDYKQFIFPLLFYKRLCDVFDEETQAALTESGGDEQFALFRENHRFQIPLEAQWQEVRQVAKNVGAALQTAMRAIETANPDKLYGIFGDAQWTNKDRLTDSMLRDLIEHFSLLELTVTNLPEDELGQGYEYLIKKFADDSGHTAAEFYTNRTVVHLMTEMLQPQPGESVYDPTCGSGGMLLSCITHLRQQGKEWRNVRLYGQERNLMTSSIARMNCFLHGVEDFEIVRGDTLSEPKFVEGDHLKRFDMVLANPPYSIKQWDREAFASDPWGRNLYGTPPPSNADYAFFQHILSSLAVETGRCAILFPHGVLFRDSEEEMRRKIIGADLIECIVGLGMNLFYNSAMPSCVVICRTRKSKARRGKILIINAINEVTRERAQSFLTENHINRIMDAYRNFSDEDGFARTVTVEQVRANGGSLNLLLYVPPISLSSSASTSSEESVQEAITSWFESRGVVARSVDTVLGTGLAARLHTNFDVSHVLPLFDDRKNWGKVRLGDLLEKTEETERNALSAGYERYLLVEHLDRDCLRIQRWGDISDGSLPPTFYKVFRKGQILYPTRNPHLRRAALADFDGICGEKTLTLSASGRVESRLLPFAFQSEAFITFATNRKVGSTNPHIRWRDVADFEFNLPPSDYQRRMAEILWTVDDAIEVQSKYLKSIEVAILCLVSKYLPADSRATVVGDLGSWVGGGTPSKGNKAFWNGEIPWASPKDLGVEDLIDCEDHITREAVASSATVLVPTNSVLIAARTGILRHTFPVVMTRREVAINQDLKALLPNSRFVSEFVACYLRYRAGSILRDYVKKGTTVESIDMPLFKQMKIQLPPIETQFSFLEEYKGLVVMRDATRTHLKNYNNLKASLLSVLFA
jgi:type I restriction enzyme M protein